MQSLDVISRKMWLHAIYLVALCAVFTPASAQNSSRNTAAAENVAVQEAAERQRIASERASLKSAYEAQRQACYQQLAVTPCLTQARDAHNDQMRDLKRQEVALNDVQRKRKAADRVRSIDERNSPQAQLKQAESRGAAMEKAKQRELSSAEKQASRDAKIQAAASKPRSAASTAQSSVSNLPVLPQGKPRAQTEPQLPKNQRPGYAEKIEQNRQAAARREQEAAERRAKMEQREASRKKPAAAGLPVPQ
jgi:colicin import membrane protein